MPPVWRGSWWACSTIPTIAAAWVSTPPRQCAGTRIFRPAPPRRCCCCCGDRDDRGEFGSPAVLTMMRAPAFWSRNGILAHALSPLSLVGAAVTARRVGRPGWGGTGPVGWRGNVSLGGAVKTTLVLDLAKRLTRRGIKVHVLLRGYGGSSRGVRRVTLA